MAAPDVSGQLTELSALKLAVMARGARGRLGAIARSEPLAIVGLGCRFPGGVDSPARYWELLSEGRDAVGSVPRDRWDVDAVFDPDPATPGKTSVTAGAFLGRVDEFDAGYFGILRREAERMDPQHRLFLEVAIEALDDAGLPRSRLAGSATGVFVASYYNDYAALQFNDREWIDGRTLTGTLHSVLANRLSYLLDLRGPSLSVDTACSSSLVAVHLACQSLRSGDSDIALAAGVSLMLSPDMMVALSKVGFISPSGRCRTFDAAADGFIRGEGCGVVVIRRLADAIADGDRVLAVIRGSAINQDGHSTVISAPNGLAQEALLRDALANASIPPERVGFVEAHGTGTPLGDPIEVEALATVLGAPRADGGNCYLGSVKANIGHLEAAAGVAGLIKATLALQHGEIPRQVHFTRINPHISLDRTCLKVADHHVTWTAGSQPRVAGVSGFGVGGTNAHVVLEEAPQLPVEIGEATSEPQLLALSAQSPAALRAVASASVDHLSVTPSTLAQLAGTAGTRRTHYDHRLALVGRTKDDVADQLRRFLDGDPGPNLALGRRPESGRPRIAFVFSGQGSQWAGMGVELAADEPVFGEALDAVDRLFAPLAGWSVRDALAQTDATSRLADTEVAQPAIFAVQVALTRLWASWGVVPDAVVGHSVGEVAALHGAGVLALEDAVRIVYHRSRVMQRATGSGRMVAAALTAPAAAELMEKIGGDLSLAAVNGPRSVVLAGSVEAVERAEATLVERDVQHRRMPVAYAFHSAQMEPLRNDLVEAVRPVDAHPAQVAVYSTVTGGRLDGRVDAEYVGRNMRQTVRFADAMNAMLADGTDVLIEIAPHPVLAPSLAECTSETGREIPIVASSRRQAPERSTMLHACARAYAAGASLRWEAIVPPVTPVTLPSYPWQRERFWLRDAPSSATGSVAFSPRASALLGSPSATADGAQGFTTEWPSPELDWVTDHVVGGRIVMPAAGLLETLRAAVVATTEDVDGPRPALVDVVIHRPLLLNDDGRAGWTTDVRSELDVRTVTVWAGDDDGAGARIASAREADEPVGRFEPSKVQWDDWNDASDALYARIAELGVSFGPSFRRLTRWRLGDGAVEAELAAPTGARASGGLTPEMLDAALQACVVAATPDSDQLPTSLLLPVAVETYRVAAPDAACSRAEARVRWEADGRSLVADVRLWSDEGLLVAALDAVRFAPVDPQTLARFGREMRDLYELDWEEAAVGEAAPDAAGAWIVVGDGAAAAALVDGLTAAGGRCSTIPPVALATADGSVGTVLTDMANDHGPRVRGVVHAAALATGDEDRVEDVDRRVTGSALALVHAMGEAGLAAPLWFVTRGAQPAGGTVSQPQQAGLWGLAATVSCEYPDLRCHVVDLDDATDDVSRLVDQLLAADGGPPRVAWRDGRSFVPRLRRRTPSGGLADPPAGEHRLVVAEVGTIDGLAWVPVATSTPGRGDVRLRVLAAGLNFRDVLLTLGMYPGGGLPLGAESAGIVEELGDGVTGLEVGQVVFGFAPASIGTAVTVPAAFVRPVPAGVSVEEAAGLPVAFLTAMYAFGHLAGLTAGQRVLVHAAAGGVGMAAVQLALHTGAEVFATAGSPRKRDAVRALGVEHVFDSRSTRFADNVLAATGGRGVDVVLNSLSGDLITAGVRALAPGGWFLEMGKRDIWSADRMRAERPDVHYRVFDLGQEADADHALIGPMLDELSVALVRGDLRPLPVRTFDMSAPTEAFRFMAQARHVGKLVLTTPADPAVSSLVRPDATYWITGGAGALGVRTARWLIEAGARDVVLTGRTPPSGEAAQMIEECRAAGADVAFFVADAADLRAMTAVRDEIAATRPPLRGVVHAAGALDDGMLVHQTWDRWRSVLAGKAAGARVLDAITEGVPLDFFVLYSAAAVLLGPVGQGAYAAANAELDALAWDRRRRGLPALSVSWGLWAEAGMAARLRDAGRDPWTERGLGWIEPRDGFTALERLLREGATHAAVLPIDWGRFLSQLPAGLDRSFFAGVAPAARARLATAPVGVGVASVLTEWRAAPPGDRRRLVLAHVASKARQVLGVEDDVVFDERAALKDAGLDSLMAVELRNVLTRSLETSLPATLLFDHPSLDALAAYLLDRLDLQSSTVATTEPAAEEDESLAALTDEEAEALLLAELGETEGAA